MKRRTIPYSLLLCWLMLGSLFSSAHAQAFLNRDAVYADGGNGLEIANSIVWGNVTTSTLGGDTNFTDADGDPLFASETDFALRAGSPAAGKGDNSVWSALPLGLASVDIAGAPHGTPMSMGAYEVGTIKFKVNYDGGVTGGTVIAYFNNKNIAGGTDVAQGSELIVTATPQTGYRLVSLSANGGKIENGEVFILTANVEFSAVFEATSRTGVYGTMQSGGTLSILNSIIYDNVDLFGNYSLDKTNVIADPKFQDLTDFVLQTESPALGLGDGTVDPLSTFNKDVAGTDLNATTVASGAYQPAMFKVEWTVSGNGSLQVVREWTNESKESVEDPLTSGNEYPQGTIIVRATPDAGHKLTSLKVNGDWINAADANKDLDKDLLLLEGSFSLTSNAVITAEFTTVGSTMLVAVQVDDASTLVNNIIYDNLHTPSNRIENPQAPSNYTEDPKFVDLTNFNIQSISPVINKGTNAPENETYAKDLANQARVQGGVVDMGAFESMSDGFIVTYNKEITAKGVRVATVELWNLDDNNAVIASGSTVAADTEIHVEINILDANYERIQRIRLNNGVKDEYLDDLETTTFKLKSNITVGVAIQAKEYVVSYEATNAQLLLYNGSALVANGAKVGYGTVLSVIVNPETGYDLQFVAVNGKHIDGAEAANGYAVRVESDVTITTNAINTSVIGLEGIISWDALNATVTVTDQSGTPVELGSSHAPGTILNVKIEPVASTGYRLALVELNGVSYPYTEFAVTIPAADGGKVGTTFIGVRYEADATIAPPPAPDPTNKHIVTTIVDGSGSLTMTQNGSNIQSGGEVAEGSVLTINAVASTGYYLSKLTVNGLSVLSGGTVTVSEATSVIAIFVKEDDPTTPDPAVQSEITLSVSGYGTVTMTDDQGNTVAPGDWVDNTSVITVSALPANGYEFSFITVNTANLDNHGSFNATANTEVVVEFNRLSETPSATYKVTTGVVKSGMIRLANNGIEILSGESVQSGTELTITATPAADYKLTDITVNGVSVYPATTIRITADSEVIAIFSLNTTDPMVPPTPAGSFDIYTSVVGSGAINLTVGGSPLSDRFVADGTDVTVTAVANANYNLTGLMVNGTTIASGAVVTITEETTVVATFERDEPGQATTYAVTTAVTGNGTLALLNSGTAIQSGEMVPAGTVLDVVATAAAGYELTSLTANGVTLPGTTITITKATEILAVFNQSTPSVPGPTDKQILVTVAGNGTVMLTNEATSAVIASGDYVPENTLINVSATAGAGYGLTALTVNGTSILGAGSFTLTADTEVKAIFTSEPVNPVAENVILIGSTGNGTVTVKNGGTEILSGQKVQTGTVLTVTASANAGYAVSDIRVNGVSILPGNSFTVQRETTIEVLFNQDPEPTPGAPTDKKVYITLVGEGSATLKDAMQTVIRSGDYVAENSSLIVTATAASNYTLGGITVNGAPYTSGNSFTVTEETYVVVTFNRNADPVTPPVTPPVPPTDPNKPSTEYVTLTVGGGLPAGITINPGAGTYQVEKGSNQVFRITADSRYDNMYLFLKVGDQYVKLQGTNGTYTYTLVNITGNVSIGIVVSETPDPLGTDDIEGGSRIWTESGQVCIQTDAPGSVRIVTFNGRVQTQQNLPAGESRIQLPDGFYIVVLSDGTTKKIAVRNF